LTPSLHRAEALGAALPPLLVAAERVASTVWQGVHGRRRVGQGDSFWQFRPFLAGDAAASIDWRQSARSDRHFVRETEWEAAQTVALWRDAGPAMRWCSAPDLGEKRARAELLALALAALLLRGGERVRWVAPPGSAAARPVAGRGALARLAETMGQTGEAGLPNADGVPRHARVVVLSDMLAPVEQVQEMVRSFAGVPVRGHILQVLDPAEAALPYAGRVRFVFDSAKLATLVPRVEGIREAYARRLRDQQAALRDICAAAGWGFAVHHTDHAPQTALLGLYTALAPEGRS
jgi:uncharacterized protein (DUF58 family)